MKTAMKELIDELRSFAFDKKLHLGMGDIFLTQGHIDELEVKYIEKEKEQIIDAFNEPLWITGKPNIKAEEYYNQTYNKDKELPKDVKDMLDNL
jgi:hypothetical protein